MKRAAVLFLFVIFAVSANASVIQVPDDYTEIQSAIDAASDGDTVLVDRGEYRVNLDFLSKDVALIGAGADQTILRPEFSEPTIRITGVQGPTLRISGFTIADGHASTIYLSDASPVISDNVFHDNVDFNALNVEVITCHTNSHAFIAQNLFYLNGGIGCIGVRGPSRVRIIGNTFDRNARGFFSVANGPKAINNIVTNSRSYGIVSTRSYYFDLLDYNNVYNNAVDYATSATVGPGSISADPLFLDPENFAYSLLPESPCLDTGDPTITDPDGTRSDIGKYYPLANLPTVRFIHMLGEETLRVLGETPTFEWEFLGHPGTSQMGLEVEISLTEDFNDLFWQMSSIDYADTSLTYAGPTLVDGTTYYVRLRVYDGASWGAWAYWHFRTNTPPPVPELAFPAEGQVLPENKVLLSVYNTPEGDGDSRLYEFTVFSDPELNQVQTFFKEIQEDVGEPTTSTPVLMNLAAPSSYWWRARASDGYETSAWSPVRLVQTRGPGAIKVPDDAPTIQQAIDISGFKDTIYVQPGVYRENLFLYEKAVTIVSTAGPDSTTLMPDNEGESILRTSNCTGDVVRIEGFEITGGGPTHTLAFTTSNAEVIGNIFHDNIFPDAGNKEVVSCNYSNVLVYRNIFYHNQGISCVVLRDWSWQSRIINNTFDGNARGIYSSYGGTAINNIITNQAGYGVGGATFDGFDSLDFNDVWNNGRDYENASAGAHSISADPLFVDAATHDYRINYLSPCYNAGDPDSLLDDPDGSRSDMGAIPVEFDHPILVDFSMRDQILDHVTNAQPVFEWVFVDTGAGYQKAVDFEVGIDRDWSEAEMWNPNPFYTARKSKTYGGQPLVDGQTYWVRMRAQDNLGVWGSWLEVKFRMNSSPAVPELAGFDAGSVLPVRRVALSFLPSEDAENDTLTYQLQAYSGGLLVDSIYFDTIVGPVHEDTVVIDISNELPVDIPLLWRCRANDGYENSPFSPGRSFQLRDPAPVRVPGSYATIMEAVRAAGPNDSIIVGAGTYLENIVVDTTSLSIIGEGGAAATILSFENSSDIGIRANLKEQDTLRLSGLTLQGSTIGPAIVPFDGTMFIRECTFRNNGSTVNPSTVILTGVANLRLERSTFFDNEAYYCVNLSGEAGEVWIANNTFDHNRAVLSTHNQHTVFVNNVLSNCSERAVSAYPVAEFDLFDYNLFWQNAENVAPVTIAGYFDIEADPLFVDAANHDYHLRDGSPCIDGGHPDPQFNDADGTRNDIGALTRGGCCFGFRGDVNGDGVNMDPVDLSFAVDYLFGGATPVIKCQDEADVNGDGVRPAPDAVDLSFLVDWLFSDKKPEPVSCW